MEIPSLVARMRQQQVTAGPPGEAQRREWLRGLLAGLERREADLLEALRQDLRKSPTEAFTTEVGYVAGEIRHALSGLRRWMKPERRPAPFMAWPASGWVEKQPYGNALILGPWNYPIQLVLTPLVGALAAGCRAVVKPSELAPRSSEVLCRLIAEVFPPEVVACVAGDQRVAEALLEERFDVVFYTGGGVVGRKVMAAAARHLTPVTLELGGRSPCLVCPDAPLELTARRIAWGKWLNAGQTCVAPDHVWVPRGKTEEWVAVFGRVLREFYGSDAQASPDYGRIIHARHFERLTGYLGEGRVAHGGRHDAADLYLEPTLLTDLPTEAAILQEEVFGPILPIVEYDSLEEWLALQRGGPAPLALYLFTADRAVQKRVLAGSRSGGVCINDTLTHILGKHLPLGGLGESGMGFCHGRASFDAFTHRRSVLRRDLGMDVKMRYPPARIPLDRLKRALRWFGNA